ncbi:MAG: membrane dipeptidase [Clostridia bacterium]|nr:membrane dipeptidase [Clostridia bacterium]
MKHLPLFDLHCDTLYETHKQNKSLFENDLCLSLARLSEYKRFCQILAMWSDHRIGEEEAYTRFFEAHDMLTQELAEHTDIKLCTCEYDLAQCERDGHGAVFLAVEGGKLIADDLTRLDTLYKNDVRFLTLVWNDPSRLGGSNLTDEGLTTLGFDAVRRCFSLGIIPDVSHASDKMTDEVIALAEECGRVCVATHSNSRAVCDHRRNLTDERFCHIARLGGIVGISLAPMHLTHDEVCTIDDIVRHIEHYLSLGGEDTVCLGCDLDGVDILPEGIKTVSDIEKIAEALGRINYTDDLIEKIFYANARNFISLWLN